MLYRIRAETALGMTETLFSSLIFSFRCVSSNHQTSSSATLLKSNLSIIENGVHNDMPKQPCKEEVIERIVGFFRYQIMDHCQYDFFHMLQLEVEMSMMKLSIVKLTCLEESDLSSSC